jgi:hypothetical protein
MGYSRGLKVLLPTLACSVLLVTAITGCNGSDPAVENSSPPTPTFCPTKVAVPVQEPNMSPMLLVVLVEGTPSYSESANRSLKILSGVLPNVMEPGDWLIMAWMERSTLNKAVFVNEKVRLIPLPSFPAPPPTPLRTVPTITPKSTPQTRLGIIVATRNAEMTSEALNAISTQTTNDYFCEVQKWYDQKQRLSKEWERKKENAIRDFVAKVNRKIEETNPGELPETTRVFETLSLVSKVFEAECSQDKYSNCVLLIFSDMYEWRKLRPDDVMVDLKNVDVFIVLLDCTFLYQSNCARRVEYWTPHLDAYQARNVSFTTGENIEDFLIESLRR